MQYKKNTLYKEINKENPELSTDFIEKFLNFTLSSIKEWSLKPDNLILNVKKFGKFHWKYQKLIKDRDSKKYFTDPIYKKSMNHVEFIKNTDFVIEKYKEFHEKKTELKKLRHGDNFMEREDYLKHKKEQKELLKKQNEDNKYNYKILV